VIDRFLPVAARLLSNVNGMLYLLLLEQNKPSMQFIIFIKLIKFQNVLL